MPILAAYLVAKLIVKSIHAQHIMAQGCDS